MSKLSIAIAGTTHRTTQCAQSLFKHPEVTIPWILTPTPKPIGRKQVITQNPLDVFASENKISTVHVEKKITATTQDQIKKLMKPDFLLVVDFGYIVPDWLLSTPRIAPVNIHPSDLPKWRGSSPAQFSLLYNETNSAVTVMVMDEQLDHGPIITKEHFSIDPNWNHEAYYQYAFDLITPKLSKIFLDLSEEYQNSNTIIHHISPQPEASPTSIARQLKKADAYVPWEVVAAAMKNSKPENIEELLSPLLLDAYRKNKSLALTLERASKAFSPWPELWTKVQTKSGETRMKLLAFELSENNKMKLITVQLAGKQPGPWEQIKTGIQL